MKAVLEAQRVSARYADDERDVIRDVSLSVAPGEIVGLIGPNGSGKSSLLSLLGADLLPRQGQVLLDGEDTRRIRRKRFARRVGRLPQDPAHPEGLLVGALVLSGRHAHRAFFEGPSADDRRAVRAALDAMGLNDFAHRRIDRISGGERRRAWIAMVLAQEAQILLLDEPTAALDLRHQWEVIETLARVSHDRGVGIVAALHDLEQAAHFAHRIAVMHRGRLYDTGPPDQCIREEMIRDVYEIDADVSHEGGGLRLLVRGPADPIRSL